ncbi:At2g23090 like protein [Obelidium mucronatum]|nr:At2g23090 like protein [Obelidium mucronatum]
MVRGIAKEQAKERANKKAAAHGVPNSQFKARAAGLQIICPICRAPLAAYKLLVGHYESKHPKETPPAESTFSK